jgi:hypothetical protein
LIKTTVFGSKYVNAPATMLSTEAHILEEQFVLEDWTINKEMCLIYGARTQRPKA